MNMPLSIKVSKKIKEARIKAKLTQEQLAELSAIDYKYIQKIEGKNPPNITLKTLEKISKVLKTLPSTLID